MPSGETKELRSLQIGASVVVSFDGEPRTAKARLVGFDPGHFLILRFPILRWLYDHLYEGNAAVFKMVSHATGQVIAFRGNIFSNCFKPQLILAITTYPESVESYSLRKEKRISCYLPASAILAGTRTETIILDISPGGCRVGFQPSEALDQAGLDPDQLLTINVSLLGMAGEQTLNCRIRNVSREETILLIGLCWEELDLLVDKNIKKYVDQVYAYLGEPGDSFDIPATSDTA